MFFFLGAHCPRLFLILATYSYAFFLIVSLGYIYLAILVPIGTSSLVRIAGGRRGGEALRPPPCTPPPAFTFCFYFFIGSPCYLLSLLFLIHLTIFLLISIESCACVLLSCYALRGEALRPPPCHPPPLLHFAFIFWSAPLATYSHSFCWVHLIFIGIYPDLCLCASFSVRMAVLAFVFNRFYLLPTPFFSHASFLWVHLIFIDIFGFGFALLVVIEYSMWLVEVNVNGNGNRSGSGSGSLWIE